MAKASKNTDLTAGVVVPGKSLFDRVAEYLDVNDWRYKATRERGHFSMDCQIAEAVVRVVLNLSEDDNVQRILVLSAYPIFLAEHRRSAVLKIMNEINFTLVNGCFELDPADGQVRFRTSVEADTELTQTMMDRVLNGNLSSADRHFAALMATAFGVSEPGGSTEIVSRPAGTTLQ